jgi:hypothetical protein
MITGVHRTCTNVRQNTATSGQQRAGHCFDCQMSELTFLLVRVLLDSLVVVARDRIAPYSTKVQQPPPHTAAVHYHQHARQSMFFKRVQQRAGSYGSKGWGFESRVQFTALG